MGAFLLRRAVTVAVTVLVATVLNFVIMNLAPGDPATLLTGLEQPSEEVRQALRVKYGLDQPLHVRLFRYLGNLARGDLGHSIAFDQPVARLLLERLPATLLLTVSGAVLALVAGTLLGIFSARRYGSPVDVALSFICYVLYSMPSFWLGLMLILVFASGLKWLPTSGMTDPREVYRGWAYYADVARHLVLPATSLALVQLPVYYRIARASMVQVLKEDFVTTLRATGMDERRIFRRYAFKNAILPTVTIFGLHLGFLFAGAALVEIVFAWPGLGRLVLSGVFRRDYPLLMGAYVLTSVTVAVAVLITDLLYAWLDPRIRYT